MGQPFRILCLDGGGIRGVFSAQILATIDEEVLAGQKVVDYCDLIAGTSTGGLIALALAFGKSPAEIVHFYRTFGRDLFDPSRRWLRKFKQVLLAPYSQGALESAISKFIKGKHTLADAQKRLVLTSYNADAGNVHVIKHLMPKDREIVKERLKVLLPQKDSEADAEWERCKALDKYAVLDTLRVEDAGAATAAAPTYFPAKRLKELQDESFFDGPRFLDGGVWANVPIWAAVAEAVGPLGRSLDDVRVLSIGTRFEKLEIGWARRAGGWVPWNVGVLDLLMNAQAAGAVGSARWCLGRHFLRLDDKRAKSEPGSDLRVCLDDARDRMMNALVERGKAVVRRDKKNIERFLMEWTTVDNRTA